MVFSMLQDAESSRYPQSTLSQVYNLIIVVRGNCRVEKSRVLEKYEIASNLITSSLAIIDARFFWIS